MRAKKDIGLSNMPLSDQQLIINNTEIYNYYKFRLNNMALSRFTYENLPDTIDRWFLEKTLLLYGKIAIGRVKGTDIWVALPYTYKRGRLDVYNYPVDIQGYTTQQGIIEFDEFILLYDNMTREPLIAWIDLYAKLLWECHNTYRSNLNQQIHPYIITGNKNNQLSFKNFFNRLFGFEPYIAVKENINVDENIKVLNMNKEFNGNELLTCLQRTWDEACAMLGIPHGSDKKERENIEEVRTNQMQENIMMASSLLNRQEAFDKFNELTGSDVKVYYTGTNSDFKMYDGGIANGEIYD